MAIARFASLRTEGEVAWRALVALSANHIRLALALATERVANRAFGTSWIASALVGAIELEEADRV